ncbi:MAG: hypothetical protein ACM3JH_09815 [Acidithiobacillales bacterium]
MRKRALVRHAMAATFLLGFVVSGPALAKKTKTFLDSDAAKEADEPQKYLPDYGKLVEGKDADWVYFPAGSLAARKRVVVKAFESNAVEAHKAEGRIAAEYAPDFMKKWLLKEGFEIVDSGGDMVIEGNVFNAWEPSGGARFWGGWMANPGCGIEVVIKDEKGDILGFVRHKARGSTIKDAVENGLEEVAKAIKKGK